MKKKIIFAFLVLLFITMSFFTIYFIQDSYAKYSNLETGKASTSVAKPIARLLGDSEVNLEFLTLEKERYAFKVVNYDKSDNKTEVGLRYVIELNTSKSCPINYNLYKIVDGQEVKVDLTNNTYSSDLIFSTLDKQEEDYIVEIWLDKTSNVEFKKNTDVFVNLKAIQVLPVEQ